MTLTLRPARPSRRWLWIGGALAVIGLCVLSVLVARPTPRPQRADTRTAAPKEAHAPPWSYGRADARFTIIEYADLQCEYCRAYFPILRRWIDENPQVNWQWHHLPLSIHDPAATQAARLAECAGETAGNAAFWDAIAFLYANPQDADAFRAPPRGFPVRSDAFRLCVASQNPDRAIQAQGQAAARDGIMATPTLRLLDSTTGRSLLLSGPVEGDVLLSAFDLLSSSPDADPRTAHAEGESAHSVASQ